MDESRYITKFLANSGIVVNDTKLIDDFSADPKVLELANQILYNQKIIMDKWKLNERVNTINSLVFPVHNCTVWIKYYSKVDFIKLGLDDIVKFEFKGLEKIGLSLIHISEPTRPY